MKEAAVYENRKNKIFSLICIFYSAHVWKDALMLILVEAIKQFNVNVTEEQRCLQTYKKIIREEEEQEGKNTHIYINVSTGSKVSSIAGTLACMIWKGTPYYAHMDYNDKKDPADGLPDEDVTAIDEIPVYSINKPKPESLVVLKILNNMKEGEGRPKMMKKGRLIEELEKADIIDKNLSIGAKHSKLKGLLNSISIAGSDNPLVEVEYKGKQSNIILTTQGESTLKIFGE
jgi:hypothetical protein